MSSRDLNPYAGIPDPGLRDSGTPDPGLPDSGLPDPDSSDSDFPDSGLPDSSCADVTYCPQFRKRNPRAADGRYRALRFNGRIVSVQRAPHGGLVNTTRLFGAFVVEDARRNPG